MFSLNRVHLIGYQSQPVTPRQTPTGTSVVDLNIVVPYAFRSEKGEMLTGKSFHTVTLWGGLADMAGQFVKPGAQVFIGGRLQTDSWEDTQTHEKRSKTKIIGSEIILLDPKSGQTSAPDAKQITNACNRADLIGNVTRDPEMRTTTSGQKVLTLGVATNESWKDKTTGERKERSEFHNVVIWGDLAEEVSRFVHKGNKVFVSGRVQTRSFETQAGAKRQTTEIVAETFTLLGVRNTIAEEAIQSAPRVASDESRSSAYGEDTAPALTAVPDISYETDVKVEDLPF